MKAPSTSNPLTDIEILRLLSEIYIKKSADKTRWPFDDDALMGPSVDEGLYTIFAIRISYKLVRLQKLCNWLRRIGNDKLATAVHIILETEIIRRCTPETEPLGKAHHILVYEVCAMDDHPVVICFSVQEARHK